LVSNGDYSRLEADVDDADREEHSGFVADDRRLVAALEKLQRAQDRGRDADVGLTNWTDLEGKICVLDPDCVPGASNEGWDDPEQRRRVMSDFILQAAKCAHSVGAAAVVVPVPANSNGSVVLDVARVPAPDMFDENTGKWDPDALNRDRVPIPVISVAPPIYHDTAAPTKDGDDGKESRPKGLGRGVLRPGTVARIEPEAPNFAFYQKTGIKPLVYLDMVGDTDFDVVLLRADKCELDAERATATVRIVTREAKLAREEEVATKVAKVSLDKEEDEALAAEAAALKERQEADEAEAVYQEEERQARLAEQDLEAKQVLLHHAEDEAKRLREAAEAREAQADALQSKVSQGRSRLKELGPRLNELTNILKQQGKKMGRKLAAAVLGGGSGDTSRTPEEEEWAQLNEECNTVAAMIAESAAALDVITAEMDDTWQQVDEAQRRAQDQQSAVLAAEIFYRKEKAEAELARVRRDKELAEAEEAEANARRERAEADAAMAAARQAEEEAAKARAREKAQREDFERRVADAASAMERAQADKVSGAAAAAEAAQREQRKERERLLKMLAAQEEKRQLEAEAEAQVRAESEKKFKELAVKREAELQAMRAQGGAAEDGDDGEAARARSASIDTMLKDKTERFPWRRTRTTLEPGFTRQPRPALANDFMHVMQGWEGEPKDGQSHRRAKSARADESLVDKRIAAATANLPMHLRKAAGSAALSLASADYLQALKEWDQVDETAILEGDTLKLSGRLPPDADRELAPVSLTASDDFGASSQHASLLSAGPPSGSATPMSTNSRTTTPGMSGSGVPHSQPYSLQSRSSSSTGPAAAKVKFFDGADAPPAFSRRPSTDLAAVQERLVLEDEPQE